MHVYRAIGAAMPRFAHLPMILGPDRKRLSKRHGATSVEQLRDAGYLAEAVVNYLALLGWSLDGERELFSLDELSGSSRSSGSTRRLQSSTTRSSSG